MKHLEKALLGLASISGFTGTTCSVQRETDSSDVPNIVLIMCDDMGIECMGYYGNIEYNTPNIDRLAAQSIRFDRCFAQPLCTPSRVKIMTGKYNFRNYEDFGWLNPDQVTFGNLLQEAGYATCVVGKWQLNGLNRNNPGNQDTKRPHHFGFDEYCLWQLHHARSEGERYANPLITQNGRDLPGDENAYGPDIFADYISDFIARKSGNPFLVYYPMVLPHNPFVPTPDSPEWNDPEKRYEEDNKFFADMVEYIDKIVFRIENALKDNDAWENTILIFTSDNGTNQRIVSKTNQGDIIGGKGKTLNTGIHVPMIISWPKYIKQGKILLNPIDFADILPTLADAARIDPSTYSTDGISLFKVLTGTGSPVKNEIFMHYSKRWGSYERMSGHTRLVTNGIYKLYRNGEFYNTHNDPDEENPLPTLNEREQMIMEKYDAILRQKENEFPFSWNDKEFNPQLRNFQ